MSVFGLSQAENYFQCIYTKWNWEYSMKRWMNTKSAALVAAVIIFAIVKQKKGVAIV